ncbi:MAG: hydroxymethylpyrimidine/phosphomethylpyrimidine kinase [Proteobacteria bacterium]|nr:hydroxymethylpyrimidine/phosphomethylpyrimidine kinase [Pseudomonadota bacterium]
MSVLPNKTNVPIVLSIAGLDPSGGAGVYTDMKTFSALNVWGMGVVTTLTNQDAKTFKSLQPVNREFFEETIETIFSNYKTAAIKIGLITERFQIEKISQCLQKYTHGMVVLDPVISSSTGFNFWNDEVPKMIIEKLLPFVDVVTPNHAEALALLKMAGLNDCEKINRKELVRIINKQFRCKVAMTGGDVAYLPADEQEGKVEDIFYDGLELKHRIGTYIDIPSHFKHGTGCTFSSALASYLARGEDFISSCFKSAFFVETALNNIMIFGKNNGGIDQNASHRVGSR